MATFELDPLFVKALKLLHSKAKDSAEQLRQMHDDVIAQRKGLPKVKSEKSDSRSGSPAPSSSSSRSAARAEEEKRRDAEKRNIEKLKQDLSDLSQEPVKKIKLESREHSPVIVKEEPRDSGHEHKDDERESEKEKRRHREKERRDRHDKEKKHFEKAVKEKKHLEKRREEEKAIKRKVFGSDDEDDDNGDERAGDGDKGSKKSDVKAVAIKEEEGERVDPDEFAFDLGISCVVCRSFEVSSVNQLIECQECHSLYHQECHRPTVTEQDVNDPRFVWYCSRCSKTLKKMVTKPSKGKSSVILPAKMSSSSGNSSSTSGNSGISGSSSSSKNSSGSSSSTSPSSGGIGSSSVPMTSLLKHSVKADSSTPLFPFRRVEPKSNLSSKDTGVTQSSKPLAGLAGWAANLSGKSSSADQSKQKHSDQSKSSVKLDSLKPYKSESSRPPSVSSSSSRSVVMLPLKADHASSSKTSSTKPPGSSTSTSSSKGISGGAAAVISADKRMQMMKKKAAAKIQERKNSFK